MRKLLVVAAAFGLAGCVTTTPPTAIHQPMTARPEPRALAVPINGAIYNAPDLTRGLASSYPFRSHTDTEVILALYEQYGIGMLDRIDSILFASVAAYYVILAFGEA